MADNKPDVATPSPQVAAMAAKWELISDLLAGTDAMRAAGTKWLPREPMEEEASYQVRLRRSFLWAIYAETVAKWMGQAFNGEIDVSGVHATIRPFLEDFDLSGNNITTVARRYMEHAVTFGLGHLFIEHTRAPDGATLADVKDARPYAILVDPRTLLGWRRLSDEGPEKLGRIRFMETVPAASSQWDDGGAIPQVRVLELQRLPVSTQAQPPAVVAWSTWRQSAVVDDEPVWTQHQAGVFDARMDEIPWATVYGERTGLLTADPPLRHLADLNLAHWQSYSDYRNTLRLTAVPMLLAAGFTAEELPSIVVSATRMLRSTKTDADVRWVEFSGAALASQRQHLVDIEGQGKAIGTAVLNQRTGDPTATESAIAKGEANADLHTLLQSTEDALNQAIYFMGRWVGVADAGKVVIPRKHLAAPGVIEDGPINQGN